MEFRFYLEKLFSSEKFKDFKKQNPDAYLCSAFFSIDKIGNDNQQHLDFYLPSKKKSVSFKLEKNLILEDMENYGESPIEKLDKTINFNFSKIENLFIERMQQENINKQIQKLLFSIQTKNNKSVLIATIFISGLGLIKAIVDLNSQKIVEFKEKSFFDMMKVLKL